MLSGCLHHGESRSWCRCHGNQVRGCREPARPMAALQDGTMHVPTMLHTWNTDQKKPLTAPYVSGLLFSVKNTPSAIQSRAAPNPITTDMVSTAPETILMSCSDGKECAAARKASLTLTWGTASPCVKWQRFDQVPHRRNICTVRHRASHHGPFCAPPANHRSGEEHRDGHARIQHGKRHIPKVPRQQRSRKVLDGVIGRKYKEERNAHNDSIETDAIQQHCRWYRGRKPEAERRNKLSAWSAACQEHPCAG